MRPGVCARGRRSRLRLRAVSRAPPQQYRRGVSGGSFPEWSQTEQVRVLIPVFAVGTAIIAAVADPSSGADLILCGLAAAPFLVWAYVPGVPLPALSLAVIVPAVVAQRSGQLEPLLFEVSLLAFVIGRSASWPTESVALGLLALLAPVVATRDPGSVRDLDGDLDPRHRLPVGLRPRGRTPGRARRRAQGRPGASSRSRRCWSSGAGSPATSTTSWATGWPP